MRRHLTDAQVSIAPGTPAVSRSGAVGPSPVATLDLNGAVVLAAGSNLLADLQSVSDAAGRGNVVAAQHAQGPSPDYTLPTPASPWQDVGVFTDTGTADVLLMPVGYAAVVLGRGTHVTLRASDNGVSIVSGGYLDFSGGARLVAASGGSGLVNDTTPGAIVDLGGGAYSVTTSGAASAIRVANGGPDSIVAGPVASIILGEGSQASAYYATYAAASSVSGATIKSGYADRITVNGTGHLIVDNLPGAGATTISALSGSSTIFGGTGDVYQGANGSAVTKFVATGATQTVIGGTGNDTVFGQSGSVLYNQGSGAFSYFIAGTGTATINAAGGGAIFAGPGQVEVSMAESHDLFVGGTGTDTIAGGGFTAAIFGGTGETVHLISSRSAYVVPLGDNATMDASQDSLGVLGGTNFFALSTIGNETLIGNPLGSIADTFQLVSAGGTRAHTLTLEGWHAGDGLFLIGYAAPDVATMDRAVAAGATGFTLSDGTTVTFLGAHPTTSAGSIAY